MSTGERFAYLVMVDPICNNNKYYRMMLKDGSLICEYGRVGQTGTRKVYPESKFDSLYRQKLGKGYKDMTALVSAPTINSKGNLEYKEIDDDLVKELVERLQLYAHQVLEKNYEVSYEKVTPKMITEAQHFIQKLSNISDDDSLSSNCKIDQFNEVLLRLFTSIPRRMGHVAAHLATKTADFDKILQKEQALLDVMKGQIDVSVIENKVTKKQDTKNDFTILEKLGLEIRECTDKELNEIKKMYNGKHPIKQVFKATNKKTEEKYNQYIKAHPETKPKLLWHGTRNENVWSILGTGLLLNPKAVITGKMFGHGICAKCSTITC